LLCDETIFINNITHKMYSNKLIIVLLTQLEIMNEKE